MIRVDHAEALAVMRESIGAAKTLARSGHPDLLDGIPSLIQRELSRRGAGTGSIPELGGSYPGAYGVTQSNGGGR